MPSFFLTRRLTATLAIAMTALPGLAQIIELSPTLHTKTVMSAADQSEISDFVEAHTGLIAGGDAGVVTRSRDALTKPLGSPSMTLGFRQTYSAAVLPLAESMIASGDTVTRMAGILIAGKLGTDDACAIVIESLSDPDEGVRFFAITSMGDSLGTLASNAPGLTTAASSDTIQALGAIIRDTEHPAFADAAVRALSEATRITETGTQATRSAAIVTLCEAVGDRLRTTRAASPNAEDEMISALRALLAVRDAIAHPLFDVPASAASASVRFGADAVGYVFTRQRAGVISGDESDAVEIALVRNAEQTIYQGRLKSGEVGAPQTNLFEQIERGDERQFRLRANELIGPESGIVSRYGFDRDRFIRPAADD